MAVMVIISSVTLSLQFFFGRGTIHYKREYFRFYPMSNVAVVLLSFGGMQFHDTYPIEIGLSLLLLLLAAKGVNCITE